MATGRLLAALNNNGVRAKMLVDEKIDSDINVIGLRTTSQPRQSLWATLRRWNFIYERWYIFRKLHFHKTHLFEIDIANSGTDITRLPAFQEADVIHLSWINQGMLSLQDIKKILASGKPVVWTLHDLWPVSGICHYARGCNKFKTGCNHCQLLPNNGSATDLSNKIWNRKKALYCKGGLYFVACSRWLEGQAKRSGVVGKNPVNSIANPIDTNIFRPCSKQEARTTLGLPADKKVILFVSQRVTDERKGMHFFTEAIEKLKQDAPSLAENTVVAILGGHSEEVAEMLPVKSYGLGYVEDERHIAKVYSAADVFVLPSLEDNLPNTIMEAMACGVPCVGFKVGGIPEMIDHLKNGYVAKTRDTDDLAAGIRWTLSEADAQGLADEAVRKVHTSYSQNRIAIKYIELYNHALALRHYIQ